MSEKEIKEEIKERRVNRMTEIIVHDAYESFEKLIKEEKEAIPDDEGRIAFLEGVRTSDFFKNLYKRGFTAGADWMDFHKDVKWVME